MKNVRLKAPLLVRSWFLRILNRLQPSEDRHQRVGHIGWHRRGWNRDALRRQRVRGAVAVHRLELKRGIQNNTPANRMRHGKAGADSLAGSCYLRVGLDGLLRREHENAQDDDGND